ncbi:hypothetical protein [Halarcobacter bivalviorum]|uniref:hypothetical protein n=1 Tax=Halarcobacter bivalviorum TaxID=663364 RepID=UPI00100A249D|nr:hypothetical protein [Halarcobacter bivalviorum]RXK03561.1 hypothetical protein CRU97_12015 [Halarcobacter bivalviorum]
MKYDRDKVISIFEKYEEKRKQNIDINYYELENVLKETLNLSYQTLKIVINDMYRNSNYSKVCYGYAKEFRCVEFNSLIKNFEQRNTTIDKG